MGDLYRLVYASKNLLQGSEAEISAAVSQILVTSQRNNAQVGVTGALMFNDGAFAQVLEGPRQGVEVTFERIQRDLRHGDVTVLQCAPVEHRGFPNWSMAFVGQSQHGQRLWSNLARESGFDPSRMNGDEVFAMLHGLVLEEEGLSHPCTGTAMTKDVSVTHFDTLQVRKELKHLTQELGIGKATVPATEQPSLFKTTELARQPMTQRPAPVEARSAQVELMIFRAALASERVRTTELRNELDELQVALTEACERETALRHERDLWAQRTRILASALSHEAEKVCAAMEHGQPKPPIDAPPHTIAA